MQQEIILGPKYYLGNFLDLLSFVKENYQSILSEEELAFFELFCGLEEDEQCLYVRLVCRKPLYFRFSKLSYPEISDLGSAAEGLFEKGFLKVVSYPLEIAPGLLDCFTKAEIAASLSKVFPEVRLPRSWSRDEFLFLAENEPQSFFSELLKNETIISPVKLEIIELYGFLFFGNLHFDMSRFVVRDLGRVKFEEVGENGLSALFTQRKEMQDCLALYRSHHAYHELVCQFPPGGQLLWFLEEVLPLSRSHPKAEKVFNKICLKVAKQLEKENHLGQAVQVYRHCKEHPARERRIRIYQKQGKSSQAISLARKAVKNPYNTTEKIFAEDFLKKGAQKFKKSTTVKLQQIIELLPVSVIEGPVEECVIQYYTRQGYEAFFSENYPFKALFGLLFWDLVFDSSRRSSPFQVVPAGLAATFFEENKVRLKALMSIYKDAIVLRETVQRNFERKAGISNPFVFWYDGLLAQVLKILDMLPNPLVLKIMNEICFNPMENSTGFPDLFVHGQNSCFFVEVKSENDQLSNKQLFWINFLQDTGVAVKIVRPVVK